MNPLFDINHIRMLAEQEVVSDFGAYYEVDFVEADDGHGVLTLRLAVLSWLRDQLGGLRRQQIIARVPSVLADLAAILRSSAEVDLHQTLWTSASAIITNMYYFAQ